MENVKNRVNIHATTSDKNAVKWFSKVNLKNAKIFLRIVFNRNV